MATMQRRLVHKQFNSPINLYSQRNIQETLDRELKQLSNGAIGLSWGKCVVFRNRNEKLNETFPEANP
ncbi:hypothetical protein quinque_005355 [Culex quinquefasciatus]